MSTQDESYDGHRVSYDGAMCTIRCRVNKIPNTKGEWLGVEWDDPARGKHNGVLHGVRYFQCRSHQPTVASFVRPTRTPDAERTVLEAIKTKYVGTHSALEVNDTVVISGKVAEEVGFDKIIKEQSTLSNSKIVILDFMVVTGVAPRGSSSDAIKKAQGELSTTCPNITDLDLSYNPIENWIDVEGICDALPKLRTLKLNIRFRDLQNGSSNGHSCFQNVQELHLNECLLSPSEVLQILQSPQGPRFPALRSLWLSQNGLSTFHVPGTISPETGIESVRTLMLENNSFTTLDSVGSILDIFPHTTHISLQSNKISSFGSTLLETNRQFPLILNLNLSQNDITSYEFTDLIPQVFPNLSALRISKNPVYDRVQASTFSAKPSEISYYLTLARIPNLKTLNYTDITPREREEGEIYYLSVAEKDVRTTLAVSNTKDAAAHTAAITTLTHRYPRYTALCTKHDREDLIAQLSSTSLTTSLSTNPHPLLPSYPPGTLASRLITTTFYTPSTTTSSSNSNSNSNPTTSHSQTITRPLPSTLPTSTLHALASRTLHLLSPLTLTYESAELDPVRDDMTTRSQMYGIPLTGKGRWDDWGDWDADEAVERSTSGSVMRDGVGMGGDEDGVIKREGDEEGVVVRGGRKWRRREVRMLFGGRPWGDWLEAGVRECRIRVEVAEWKGV